MSKKKSFGIAIIFMLVWMLFSSLEVYANGYGIMDITERGVPKEWKKLESQPKIIKEWSIQVAKNTDKKKTLPAFYETKIEGQKYYILAEYDEVYILYRHRLGAYKDYRSSTSLRTMFFNSKGEEVGIVNREKGSNDINYVFEKVPSNEQKTLLNPKVEYPGIPQKRAIQAKPKGEKKEDITEPKKPANVDVDAIFDQDLKIWGNPHTSAIWNEKGEKIEHGSLQKPTGVPPNAEYDISTKQWIIVDNSGKAINWYDNKGKDITEEVLESIESSSTTPSLTSNKPTDLPPPLPVPQGKVIINDDNADLKNALNHLGYDTDVPNKAIRDFQKEVGLKVDGKAGEHTVTAINNKLIDLSDDDLINTKKLRGVDIEGNDLQNTVTLEYDYEKNTALTVFQAVRSVVPGAITNSNDYEVNVYIEGKQIKAKLHNGVYYPAELFDEKGKPTTSLNDENRIKMKDSTIEIKKITKRQMDVSKPSSTSQEENYFIIGGRYFPEEADTNKDGMLSLEEAKEYLNDITSAKTESRQEVKPVSSSPEEVDPLKVLQERWNNKAAYIPNLFDGLIYLNKDGRYEQILVMISNDGKYFGKVKGNIFDVYSLEPLPDEAWYQLFEYYWIYDSWADAINKLSEKNKQFKEEQDNRDFRQQIIQHRREWSRSLAEIFYPGPGAIAIEKGLEKISSRDITALSIFGASDSPFGINVLSKWAQDPYYLENTICTALKDKPENIKVPPTRGSVRAGASPDGVWINIFAKRLEQKFADWEEPKCDGYGEQKWWPGEVKDGKPTIRGYIYKIQYIIQHPFSKDAVEKMNEDERKKHGLDKDGSIIFRIKRIVKPCSTLEITKKDYWWNYQKLNPQQGLLKNTVVFSHPALIEKVCIEFKDYEFTDNVDEDKYKSNSKNEFCREVEREEVEIPADFIELPQGTNSVGVLNVGGELNQYTGSQTNQPQSSNCLPGENIPGLC